MKKADLQIKWSKPISKQQKKIFIAVVAEGDVEKATAALQIGFKKFDMAHPKV
jgi:hypothetical protein